MKIYNKIVWDKDFNIIEEDSYEYEGPVAYTKGKPPSPSPIGKPPPLPMPSPRPKSRRAYKVGKTRSQSSEIGSESRDTSLLNTKRRSGRKSLVTRRGEALGVGVTKETTAQPTGSNLMNNNIGGY